MDLSEEVLLPGGTANRGRVVRIGDTVRRPLRPGAAARHALLRYLEDVGFDGAPRLLGVDDRGREVLSYVPGDAMVVPPFPAWSLTDAALRSVARLLRRYHEAVAGFDPSSYDWWVSLPEQYRGGLALHNDPNVDNVVFRDGIAVALIDFDLATPGRPLWDVAAAARLWVPLRPDPDIDDARRGRVLTRLRLFADAYDLGADDREQLVEAAAANHVWCMDYIRSEAQNGHAWFSRRWHGGEAELTDRTNAWFAQYRETLRAAILS